MTRKYNISVNIFEKLASLCFKSFGKAHERRKYFILLAMPINTTHYVLSAHAHNLVQYVGKIVNRLLAWSSLTSTLQRAGYVLYRALVYTSDLIGANLSESNT